MIHSEIVLESNCRKCLGSGLNLHILLGLDCLVETVTPSSALHDTARLLIDNLHFAVIRDNVIDILFEHRISLQKLDDSMDTLALQSVIFHERVLLGLLFRRSGITLLNIGHH